LAVPLPVLAFSQARALERMELSPFPRIGIYVSSIVSLWLLGALAVVAAAASGFTSALTGLLTLPATTFVLWTLVPIAAAGALYVATQALQVSESRLLVELLPKTTAERLIFVLLSFSAGICEEFVFRGFLIPALTVIVGGSVLAGLISALLFGVLHAYQGIPGVLRAATLGMVLAVPFLVSGSIFPSMAAHTLIDIIGGLWLARRMQPVGVEPSREAV
jgi:membrane protease YdiL (CAAX protease family)